VANSAQLWERVLEKVDRELERDTDEIATRLLGDELDSDSHELSEREFLAYIFRGWVQGVPERGITPEQYREQLLIRYGEERFCAITSLLFRPVYREWETLTGDVLKTGEHGLPILIPPGVVDMQDATEEEE
jgi:hypothetical protein